MLYLFNQGLHTVRRLTKVYRPVKQQGWWTAVLKSTQYVQNEHSQNGNSQISCAQGGEVTFMNTSPTFKVILQYIKPTTILNREGRYTPPQRAMPGCEHLMTSRALRGVLGSRSPATTGFSECTLSRSPWRAKNIPDGSIHTLGAGCTVTTTPEQCPTRRYSLRNHPTVTSTRFGSAINAAHHIHHPEHPAKAAGSPTDRWWAAAQLDR